MREKRILSLMLAVVMAATMLAGCASQQGLAEEDGKISICIYVWDRSMLKEFSP